MDYIYSEIDPEIAIDANQLLPQADETDIGKVVTVTGKNQYGLKESASSDTPNWDTLEGKPFETLGLGLSVDSEGVLSATGGVGSGQVIVIPTTNVSVAADGAISADFDNTTYNILELFDAGNLIIVSIKPNPGDDTTEGRIPLNMKYSTDTLMGFTPYFTNGQMTTASIIAIPSMGRITVDFHMGE